MNINLPLYITDIFVFDGIQSKSKPVFVNGRRFFSLTYRHCGKISLTANGESLISSADCLTFVPKNTPYTTEVLEETRITGVHFNVVGDGLPNIPAVIPAKNPALRGLFRSLSAKKPEGAAAHFQQMAVFYEILEKLCANSSSNEKTPATVAKAKEIIEERFNDPLFSIFELAALCGVSQTYLRREFNIAYGTSPIRYLKETRRRRAKELLLCADIPINKIATECGYSGSCYFVQDFHNATGESPTEYRKRLSFTP